MTRIALCALAVAFAAGEALAFPSMERAMQSRYEEMETYQEPEAPLPPPTSPTSTSTSAPETPEQWLENFLRAVQKQLEIQDTLLRQLMKDVLDFLRNLGKASGEEGQSNAMNQVNAMMQMISHRMAVAREAANDMAKTDPMEREAARTAASKFMKEVRVQDVVVDALWASLRGVQTSAWLLGITAAEELDLFTVANRAAEDFLARMYHHLRAAGISEEDIVKFVPKTEAGEGQLGRNMGRRGRIFGYGSGYGYPSYGYGWGYPSYTSYGWGYPSYSTYELAYPAYSSYGWGYPAVSYGWGYPSYSRLYYRRLRSAACPDCPPAPFTEDIAAPVVPPFRSLGDEPMMPMGTSPMMGANPMMGTTPTMGTPPMMGQAYNPYATGEGYLAGMASMTGNPVDMGFPVDAMAGGMTPMNTNYRSLSPVPDMVNLFPENIIPTNTNTGYGY